MSVKITDVSKSFERLNALLSSMPGAVPRASYNALRRAGDMAKTRASRLAAAEYHISVGAFGSNTKQKVKQTGAGGSASMTVSFAGSVLPLLTFNTRYSRGGVMFAKVKRQGSGGVIRRAFTARLGGRLAAYERKGTSRFPIEGKYGPSTAHMMQNEDVQDEMGELIEETYERRLDHEIARILSGWGR